VIVSMPASAAGGLVTSVPPGAGDSEGGNSDGFPAVDRSVRSRHKRGEQRRRYVLAAAGEDADSLERVEAHRQQLRKGPRIPQAGRDRFDIMHASHLPRLRHGRLLRWMPGRGARLSAASRRPAWGEPNAVRDSVEVIVGEPVPAQAQLPGQGPLAEPLAAPGRVLVDSGGVSQQARIWVRAVALTVLRWAVWRGGPDNHRHAARRGSNHVGAGRA
jgi:hypothetical protein